MVGGVNAFLVDATHCVKSTFVFVCIHTSQVTRTAFPRLLDNNPLFSICLVFVICFDCMERLMTEVERPKKG